MNFYHYACDGQKGKLTVIDDDDSIDAFFQTKALFFVAKNTEISLNDNPFLIS